MPVKIALYVYGLIIFNKPLGSCKLPKIFWRFHCPAKIYRLLPEQITVCLHTEKLFPNLNSIIFGWTG
jgi:hypothetical protein